MDEYNLKKANAGQLLYLARYTKYRNEAIAELDRRIERRMSDESKGNFRKAYKMVKRRT